MIAYCCNMPAMLPGDSNQSLRRAVEQPKVFLSQHLAASCGAQLQLAAGSGRPSNDATPSKSVPVKCSDHMFNLQHMHQSGNRFTGGGRKPAPAATRKWARQVRWHERASQAAVNASESHAEADATQPAATSGLNPTLLAAMQQQQRTDRCRCLTQSVTD